VLFSQDLSLFFSLFWSAGSISFRPWWFAWVTCPMAGRCLRSESCVQFSCRHHSWAGARSYSPSDWFVFGPARTLICSAISCSRSQFRTSSPLVKDYCLVFHFSQLHFCSRGRHALVRPRFPLELVFSTVRIWFCRRGARRSSSETGIPLVCARPTASPVAITRRSIFCLADFRFCPSSSSSWRSPTVGRMLIPSWSRPAFVSWLFVLWGPSPCMRVVLDCRPPFPFSARSDGRFPTPRARYAGEFSSGWPDIRSPISYRHSFPVRQIHLLWCSFGRAPRRSSLRFLVICWCLKFYASLALAKCCSSFFDCLWVIVGWSRSILELSD
jgi:hypothetical protein